MPLGPTLLVKIVRSTPFPPFSRTKKRAFGSEGTASGVSEALAAIGTRARISVSVRMAFGRVERFELIGRTFEVRRGPAARCSAVGPRLEKGSVAPPAGRVGSAANCDHYRADDRDDKTANDSGQDFHVYSLIVERKV